MLAIGLVEDLLPVLARVGPAADELRNRTAVSTDARIESLPACSGELRGARRFLFRTFPRFVAGTRAETTEQGADRPLLVASRVAVILS